MKMGSYIYKKIARDALRGRWMVAVAVTLIAGWLGVFSSSFLFLVKYSITAVAAMQFLEFLPGCYPVLLFGAILIALVHFFIGGIIQLGYIDFNLSLLDRRKNGLSLLFGYASSWWRMVCTKILMFFTLLVCSLFFLVPGVVASYAYAMVPYILEERQDYSVQKAFYASRRIMKGHKWELFCLRLSFLGWYLLGILTLGIGFILIIPYQSAAEAAFYNEISGRADLYYGRKRNIAKSEENAMLSDEL